MIKWIICYDHEREGREMTAGHRGLVRVFPLFKLWYCSHMTTLTNENLRSGNQNYLLWDGVMTSPSAENGYEANYKTLPWGGLVRLQIEERRKVSCEETHIDF